MNNTIKIKITGFWPGFKEDDNFLVNVLRKHFDVTFTENPDYLFCSCFSDNYLEYENCIRIFYTGENVFPDFNAFDYAIGYDNLSFGDRFYQYSNYMIPEYYERDCTAMLEKHIHAKEYYKEKTDFCSFVVSKGTGYVAPEREEFFHMLCKYKKVNSGGKFLNNIGEPDGIKDKMEFQRKHKFAIAFENSSTPGYITEKIVQAYAAGTVPIYWGASDVAGSFNPDSFVNCKDFKSFEEAIEHIKVIDEDDELYLKMLSSPALNDLEYIRKKNAGLENFLLHIILQDHEKAYRRNMIGSSWNNLDDLKRIRELRKSKIGKLILKV